MPAYYVHHELKQKTEAMTSLEEVFRGTTDSIASMNQKINNQSTWKEMECLIYFKYGIIPKVISFLDVPQAVESKTDKAQVSWWWANFC